MFYSNEIRDMTSKLKEILGQNVPVEPIVYVPEDPPDEDSEADIDWTPNDKFLFQFDPNQMPCNSVQTAMWRLWIEGELLEQGSWSATNEQIVARRKRQEIGTATAAVCPVSIITPGSSATSAPSSSPAPSASSASSADSFPSPGSVSSAPSTSSASPPGPTFAVYLALKAYEQRAFLPNGVTSGTFLVYYDEVWEIARGWGPGPDYCDAPTRSTVVRGKVPSTETPYPTATITSLQPAGTAGPTCKWIPSPSDVKPVGPGYLSCDASPTSVGCVSADAPMTACAGSDTRVYPAAQCVWEGE